MSVPIKHWQQGSNSGLVWPQLTFFNRPSLFMLTSSDFLPSRWFLPLALRASRWFISGGRSHKTPVVTISTKMSPTIRIKLTWFKPFIHPLASLTLFIADLIYKGPHTSHGFEQMRRAWNGIPPEERAFDYTVKSLWFIRSTSASSALTVRGIWTTWGSGENWSPVRL